MSVNPQDRLGLTAVAILFALSLAMVVTALLSERRVPSRPVRVLVGRVP